MKLLALAAISCSLMHAADATPPVVTETAPAVTVSVNTESTQTTGDSMSILEEGGYLLGLQLAMQMQQSVQQAKGELGDLDEAQILEGINDAFTGKEFKIDPRERWEAVIGELQKAAQEKNAEASAGNIAAGVAHIAALKGTEGVAFTDSGIAYEVLKDAEGQKPLETSKVKVHYHGTLIDGTVFDSSYERNEPAEFGLNQVISGWTEGLQLMSVGAKYRFHIPANLAYGDRATGKIGAGSTLIFDVELLEIVE